MKVLQLCKKFPYPVKDGESLAINALSRAMHDLGVSVHLLAMNTSKHYFDLKELPQAFNQYKQIDVVAIDNRLRWQDALKHLVTKDSYHISRFVSEEFAQQLRKVLAREKFDVVQLETLYLTPYIPIIREYSDALVTLRGHNVEFEIWERIARNTRNPLRRWYLKHLTRRLQQYEISCFQQYDLLAPITARDLDRYQKLGYAGPAVVTPIGVDQYAYQPNYATYDRSPSLAFIGSLDWMPNLEGLEWFLNKVWPSLLKRFPNLTLHVAGRNTPDWMLNQKIKGLFIHGEVPDAQAFINKHSIMVVPLLAGSGMRAKILEGMVLGRVVISTQLGLEGIDADAGQHVLVADTPEKFVEALSFCLNEQRTLKQLGQQARDFVAEHYDNKVIAQRLLAAYGLKEVGVVTE